MTSNALVPRDIDRTPSEDAHVHVHALRHDLAEKLPSVIDLILAIWQASTSTSLNSQERDVLERAYNVLGGLHDLLDEATARSSYAKGRAGFESIGSILPSVLQGIGNNSRATEREGT